MARYSAYHFVMSRSTRSNQWRQLNRQITGCTRCVRLVTYCQQVAETKKRAYLDCDYWGKPVENMGDPSARILIVGLAPAAHGANRTGRMFTGDRSGDFLFEAMYHVGLCNQPQSTAVEDGLRLRCCAITAICHCAPPANKPEPQELRNCRPWLDSTIDQMDPRIFVALGQLAWKAMLQVAGERNWIEGRKPGFGHGEVAEFKDGKQMLGCYHPSQQNTFTGKLTQRMLRNVLRKAIRLAEPGPS